MITGQNFYWKYPPVIVAIRKQTYVVVNVYHDKTVAEVPKYSVLVPEDQKLAMLIFKKSTMNELESVLNKKEFEQLNDIAVVNSTGL